MSDNKSGSKMSDKQLARAAVKQKMIRFYFSSGDTVAGYLAGMDSYHWLVVSENEQKLLIHKARVDFVEITESLLSEKSPDLFDFVFNIGQSFWQFCEREILGKSV